MAGPVSKNTAARKAAKKIAERIPLPKKKV
ncbi:MAG: phosphatidylcholine/phosphatidylserine synthase, partial [Mesorhizobium sp.]